MSLSSDTPFTGGEAADVQLESTGFHRLAERLRQVIDPQRLGYFGKSRFVFFYYEPRGEEVVWNDGRTYGFSCGGWRVFCDEVVPLAARHGVDVGDHQRRGDQVLVVDRELRQAYFADRSIAERFVGTQGRLAAPPAR